MYILYTWKIQAIEVMKIANVNIMAKVLIFYQCLSVGVKKRGAVNIGLRLQLSEPYCGLYSAVGKRR